MPRPSLTVLSSLLVTLVAADAAAADVINQARDPLVAAYGGVTAWNRWDGQARRYRLWVKTRQRRAHAMRISASRVPMHLDVGPDAAGRPTVVFDRCRSGAGGLHNCRVYRARPAARAQRVSDLGRGARTPAIWRDRIAYVRTRPDGGGHPEVRLSVDGHDRRVATPRRSGDDGPRRLDIDNSRVVALWVSRPPRGCFGYGSPPLGAATLSEVFVANGREAGRFTLVDAACDASTKVADAGPILFGRGGIAWLTTFEQPAADGPVTSTTYLRASIGGRPVQQELPARAGAFPTSLTRDGNRLLVTSVAPGPAPSYDVRSISLQTLLAASTPYDPAQQFPPHP